MAKSNVGPSAWKRCKNKDAKLSSGMLPNEGQGKGMMYELNVHSSVNGLQSRSSWDYSAWGMQQYMYMFATLSILDYWDLSIPKHKEIVERANRAVKLFRFIGEKKWYSTDGPASQACSTNHPDAYGPFSGMHWAQTLMDEVLFSDTFVMKYAPKIP